MGIDESNLSKIQTKHAEITISLFELLYVIGRGGFGKVWKVQYKKSKNLFALKEMSKVKIIDRRSEKSIKGERDFLSQLHHPFIVNMICSFQDQDNLYLVLDLLTGGDLRYHICHRRVFSEEQTKFFIACVLVCLEYIHSNNVIHRDIKPENLVCDENGYIAVTDFGVANKNQKDNSSETSGTPGYMSPEVLCALNHSFPVDYFALGVMGFEFMLGRRPYVGSNRREIKELVLSHQANIKRKDIPRNWSQEAADFINSLLKRKASHRLGYNGIDEVKNHAWFADFDWQLLISKKMQSPFQPKYGDNFDKKYCEGNEKIGTETKERYMKYRKKEKYLTIFNHYTFCRYDTETIEKHTSSNDKQNNTNINNNNNNNNNSSGTAKQTPILQIVNSKTYTKPEKIQSAMICNSLKPQISTRALQTPQSTGQLKKQFSTKLLHSETKKQPMLFYEEKAPFTLRGIKKPLPALQQNASMKYFNINGSSLALNGNKATYDKKHSSNHSIVSPQKPQIYNTMKFGLTSNMNYNPFLKKCSSMTSIKKC